MIILSVWIPVTSRFQGVWIPRASQGHRGILFLGDKYRSGFFGFGPVCIGTRNEMLDWNTLNGRNFAKLTCTAMGYGLPEFMGLKSNYKIFLRTKKNITDGKLFDMNNDFTDCMPMYKIAGGVCNRTAMDAKGGKGDLQTCMLRNFGSQGGTCLEGESTLYIYCSAPSSTTKGQWSKWTTDNYCDPNEDYFKTRYRTCEKVSKNATGVAQCIPDKIIANQTVNFVEAIPACLCLKNVTGNEDYNGDYDNSWDSSSSSSYSDSSSDSGSSVRNKRWAHSLSCDCQLWTEECEVDKVCNSDELLTSFLPPTATLPHTTATLPPTATSPGNEVRNIDVIGGIVGGIAGIVIIACAIWYKKCRAETPFVPESVPFQKKSELA